MSDLQRASVCPPPIDRDLYPTGEFPLVYEISPRNLARYDRARMSCMAQELGQLESGRYLSAQPSAAEAAPVQPTSTETAVKTTVAPVVPAPAASEANPDTTPKTRIITGIDFGMCNTICNEDDVNASAWEYCDCAERF